VIKLTINGKTHEVEADPDTPLLWVLREWIGITVLSMAAVSLNAELAQFTSMVRRCALAQCR